MAETLPGVLPPDLYQEEIASLEALLPAEGIEFDPLGFMTRPELTDIAWAIFNENGLDGLNLANSGPGNFKQTQLLETPDGGRLRLHYFDGSGDDLNRARAPHTHREIVISRVFAGKVINTVYDFTSGVGGDRLCGFRTSSYGRPRGLDRINQGTVNVTGSVSVGAGEIYRVPQGSFHTTQRLGDGEALTLCYFGPPNAGSRSFIVAKASVSVDSLV